jgi:hypothetical protein
MKAFELTGAALDWAVAKCEDLEHYFEDGLVCLKGQPFDTHWLYWTPSTDWAQGGPIIEREKVELFIRDEEWFAYSSFSTPEDFHGDTPLIAAMRCYVASQLGDTINIPKELQ